MKTIKELIDSIQAAETNKGIQIPAQLPLEVKAKPVIKRGKPVKSKAVFKLVIYFKEYKKNSAQDNGKRNFYSYAESYNAELQKIIICDKTSLSKVLKLLKYTFANKYKTALIYHSEPAGFEPGSNVNLIYKFNYDRLTSQRAYDFTYKNNTTKFVLLKDE